MASFPEFTGQRQISDSGGCQPLWRKDGREIFYMTLEGKLMSVELQPGSAMDAGSPRPLFQTAVRIDPRLNQYAVTGDGQRFLVLESAEPSAPPMTLVVNWNTGLGR